MGPVGSTQMVFGVFRSPVHGKNSKHRPFQYNQNDNKIQNKIPKQQEPQARLTATKTYNDLQRPRGPQKHDQNHEDDGGNGTMVLLREKMPNQWQHCSWRSAADYVVD